MASAGLVPLSPCEHGNTLASVRALLPGATVWDPACRDSKGNMRPHTAKEAR